MAKIAEYRLIQTGEHKEWKHAESHFVTAYEFVEVFRKMVSTLETIFSTSYLLNGKYALPTWRSPTGATTLFENLITPTSRPIAIDTKKIYDRMGMD